MGAPPQANATVTRVGPQAAAPGGDTVDDWDQDVDLEPAGAGDPGAKWEPQDGAAPIRAYYREATDRVRGGDGGLDVLLRSELVLTTADVEALELDTDDVVTFTVDGEDQPRTASARTIRKAKLDGIPVALQTAKLTLADA